MIKLWHKIITAIFGLGIVLGAPIIPEGNGLISVGIFEDNVTHETVYIQIPDSQYADMGKAKDIELKHGVFANPTKEGLTYIESKQYPTASYKATIEITTATTTITKTNPEPQFEDKDDLISVFEWLIPEASAAIARDASNFLNFTATSGTKAHTIGGSDTLLVVFTANAGGPDDVTGITYNSVALTQLGSGVAKAGGNMLRTWYLLNPTTGTNNVVTTRSTSNDTWNVIISYNGVSQSGFPDASSQIQDTTSPMTATVTTVADNSVAILMGYGDAAQTASTGSTFVVNNTSAAFQLYESSTFPITPAGSFSMNFTQSDATVALSMLSFAPAVAAVVTEEVSNSQVITQF